MSDDLMTMFRSLQGSLLAHRPHLDNEPPADLSAAVPVTVLTGFLGAGKSTLLARLLTDPPNGMRVKAVVNDIGRLPFDPTLVVGDGELEVELTNGCGCCEDAGDVGATLTRLADSTPDLIVLEASGVADPFALAQVVEADRSLRLDRIVAVLAATSANDQLNDPTLAPVLRRQLEAAHAVIISHAEQTTPLALEQLTGRLAAVIPGRVIVSSTLEQPMVDLLLSGSMRGAALPVDSTAPDHELVTLTAEQAAPVTRSEIESLLERLPAEIVRCKGLLSAGDADVAVQATTVSTDARVVGPSGSRTWGDWRGMTIVGTDQASVQEFAIGFGCGFAPQSAARALSHR